MMIFDRLFGNTVIPLLQHVTSFTGARHRTILSNIANADTPGYRAQDVAGAEFERQLREAAEAWQCGRTDAFRLRSGTHNRVTAVGRSSSSATDGRVTFETVPSPDAGPPGPNGNNVDLERQTVALIRNTLRHNMALELMRKQFDLIEMAIRERI